MYHSVYYDKAHAQKCALNKLTVSSASMLNCEVEIKLVCLYCVPTGIHHAGRTTLQFSISTLFDRHAVYEHKYMERIYAVGNDD